MEVVLSCQVHEPLQTGSLGPESRSQVYPDTCTNREGLFAVSWSVRKYSYSKKQLSPFLLLLLVTPPARYVGPQGLNWHSAAKLINNVLDKFSSLLSPVVAVIRRLLCPAPQKTCSSPQPFSRSLAHARRVALITKRTCACQKKSLCKTVIYCWI